MTTSYNEGPGWVQTAAYNTSSGDLQAHIVIYTGDDGTFHVASDFMIYNGFSSSISGTVTDQDHGGAPLAGIQVVVTGDPCASTTYINSAVTDALGSYTVSDVPPGPVYVHTRNNQFTSVYEWHDGLGGTSVCTDAAPVTVLPGQNSPNLNFSITVPSGQVGFNYAMVFSENIMYDPALFPSAPAPFVSGVPYWRMVAAAEVSGTPASPVSLSSVATETYALHSMGAWDVYQGVSAGFFNDFADPSYGGPFAAPGGVWESKSYSFAVGDAKSHWYIPENSLQQLPTPQNVTVTDGAQTVISWQAVPGAESYHVWFFALDPSGNPDLGALLFISPLDALATSYTYEGDLFDAGGSFAICITADQLHPWAGDPIYFQKVINRSTFFTRYDVNRPPTLDPIPDVTIDENAGLQTVSLTGITAGAGESQTLTVTAASSNPALIPNPTVAYTSPDETGSLSFTPAAGVSGAAVIIVTVNDGHAVNPAVVGTFRVTVIGAGDPPPPSLGTPFPIAADVPEEVEMSYSAAFDGTNWLAAALTGINSNWGEIVNQRISPSEEMVGASLSLGGASTVPFVALDGTNYLTIWVDDSADPNDILYGRFVSPSGDVVGDPFLIGGGDFLGNGSHAYGGGQYLAVYCREVNQVSRFFGRLISPAGAVGQELAISTGPGNQTMMNVAFDGANFFTVWTDGTTVKGRFVSPNGTLGLEISVNDSVFFKEYYVTVAFNGTDYLVVWSEFVPALDYSIYGQRISTSGALVGGVIAINEDPGAQFLPSLAWDGSKWLVAWTDWLKDTDGDGECDAGEGTCGDVYAQVVGGTGTLIGSPFPISTDAGNQLGFIAGFAEGEFLALVNTYDYRNGSRTGNVRGVFITPGFTVPGAPNIGLATAGNGNATVAFTAPASDGGGPITSYTVTSNPGGQIGTGTGSPITVTGLMNGTAYTFTVTATNLAGTGPASEESNSVTTINAHTVTATAGANGSLDTVFQPSPQTVLNGGTTSFKFDANAGYHVAGVSGCGISYDNTLATVVTYTGTTGAVTGNCTVAATFALHPPGVVTLGTPAGTIGTASPTYTWATVDGAAEYNLWVGNSGGTPVNLWYDASAVCSGGACSVTPAVSLVDEIYYWTVRGRNAAGTGAYATSKGVTVFTVVAPTLVAPSGDVDALTPTYRWSSVPGATKYNLWVGNAGGTPVNLWYDAPAVCAGSTCSVTPAASLATTTWYWTVRGQSAAGTGPWSATGVFKVAPAACATSSPTFTWSEISGAVQYNLWVGNAGGTPVNSWYNASAVCTGGTCSVTPSVTLADGTYYWTVRGRDAGGVTGPWNPTKFLTVFTVTAPVLGAPSGTIATPSPAYNWSAVSGATKYRLWVGNSVGTPVNQWYDASAVCSGSTCTVTPAVTLTDATYYWTVQGQSAAGTGPYGASKSFKVFTIVQPTLGAPSGTIGTNMPLYTWNAVSGATRYNLWVGNSGGTPVNLWYDASAVCSGGTCSVTPAVSLSSTTWYWTVRGQSAVGTGPWGTTKSFTVQ